MSGKKNQGLLFGIFIILLILVGINQIVKNKKGERTFKAELLNVTADQVTKMSLYTKGENYQEIALVKKGDRWNIEFKGSTYAADRDLVQNMLDEITGIKPDRLVANKKESWSDYDVTDTTGVRVELYGDKKKLAEVYIGRFSYNQTTRKPTTFVRMGGEKEIYAVEAYLSMTFSRDIKGLRDKSLFRGNRNDLTGITFTYPADSSFSLSKEKTHWLVDGAPADSATAIQYLNSIAYLIGQNFRDDFNPNTFNGNVFQLILQRNNKPPVEIKAYADSAGMVFNSSENPETYFGDGSANLFKKVFKGKSYFTPKKTE